MNEQEIGEVLYSLNKKAKNTREEINKFNSLRQRHCSKTRDKYLREQILQAETKKQEYYDKKAHILTTYFKPACIHRKTINKNVYEMHSNLQYVDIDKLTSNLMNFKKLYTNFLEKKFQKKVKEIKVNGKKLETQCFVFNDIITNQEVIDAICQEIEETYDDILVKGNKLYIHHEWKGDLTDIFLKHLYNGCPIEKWRGDVIFQRGDVKIIRERVMISQSKEYFLLYKVNNQPFHHPITEAELKKYGHLKIYDVDFSTSGKDETQLLSDKYINQKLNDVS